MPPEVPWNVWWCEASGFMSTSVSSKCKALSFLYPVQPSKANSFVTRIITVVEVVLHMEWSPFATVEFYSIECMKFLTSCRDPQFTSVRTCCQRPFLLQPPGESESAVRQSEATVTKLFFATDSNRLMTTIWWHNFKQLLTQAWLTDEAVKGLRTHSHWLAWAGMCPLMLANDMFWTADLGTYTISKTPPCNELARVSIDCRWLRTNLEGMSKLLHPGQHQIISAKLPPSFAGSNRSNRRPNWDVDDAWCLAALCREPRQSQTKVKKFWMGLLHYTCTWSRWATFFLDRINNLEWYWIWLRLPCNRSETGHNSK